MAVHYYTDDCTYRLPQKRLTARWLHAVAEAEGFALGEVSYIFCSAQRLLEMNREFLRHDYYTDVITFDYSDRSEKRTVAGDIFIDVETVADNALQYGVPFLEEMRRVVVHGLLHLCGQGDKTPDTNTEMHRKEDKYLKYWEQTAAYPVAATEHAAAPAAASESAAPVESGKLTHRKRSPASAEPTVATAATGHPADSVPAARPGRPGKSSTESAD